MGVVYSPALAFFPQLTQRPLLFSAIPLVSVAITLLIGFILFHLGYYHPLTVWITTGVMMVIALFRHYRFYQHHKMEWTSRDKNLLVINISLMLPLVAIAGLSAFMTDDALASWNYWAKHYVMGESPAANSMGYPLAFPYFLSYCYQLLGSIEYEGVVKAILIIFPFSLLNILVFARPSMSSWKYVMLAAVCVFPGFLSLSFYPFYALGYADPLLAAAITLSAAFLLEYTDEPKLFYVWLATIIGIVASLSKQPGFLWALWGFPLLLFLKGPKFRALCFILLMLIPVGVWLFTDGHHFAHNPGVISTSLGSNTITVGAMLATLWKSIVKYWITQPSLFLLYIIAFFSLTTRYEKIFFWLFIMPGTLLWFIFGAYDIREGLYLLTSCGLLIARGKFLRGNSASDVKSVARLSLAVGIVLFIFFSIRQQNIQRNGVEGHIYPLNASKTLVYHYFSTGAPYIYENIINKPTVKLWAGSNIFINGIFYGHNPIAKTFDDNADYFFTMGKFHSPESDRLIAMAAANPKHFEEIPLGHPLYEFRLFKMTTIPIKHTLSP